MATAEMLEVPAGVQALFESFDVVVHVNSREIEWAIVHVEKSRVVNDLADYGYATEEAAIKAARRPCLYSEGWMLV